MKNSLKILMIILSISVLTSCNSDDNGNTDSSIDPIIGNWEYSTQFENNTQTTVNDCSPSTIGLTEPGSRTDLYYGIDGMGNCVVVDVVHMSWGKLSDGSYQFTQNGFPLSDTVTFENDNNTLILEDSDTDGNGNIVVYRFIYIRTN